MVKMAGSNRFWDTEKCNQCCDMLVISKRVADVRIAGSVWHYICHLQEDTLQVRFVAIHRFYATEYFPQFGGLERFPNLGLPPNLAFVLAGTIALCGTHVANPFGMKSVCTMTPFLSCLQCW